MGSVLNLCIFCHLVFHTAVEFPPAQQDAMLACLANQANIRPQSHYFPTGTPARMGLAHLYIITDVYLRQHPKYYTRVL
jgi:hypothetical protein